MKRVLIMFSVFISVALLSGCSIMPSKPKDDSKSSSKKEKVESTDEKAKTPLEPKVVVGSLWKTGDGGNKFESKSKIDKEALAKLQNEAGKAEGEESQETDAAKEEKKPDDGRNDEGSGTIDETVATKKENENGDLISTADILSISFHPKKPKVIYVSTANDGLFKTEDAGELWKPVPFPPKNVYSFLLDSNDPDNRMFASGVVGEWGKIFRTNDGGANWEEVYTEPGERVPVTAMSQHIKDPNFIYAGTKVGTVVKSIDAGETWKNVGLLDDYYNPCTKKTEPGKKISGNVVDFSFDAKNKASMYMVTYGADMYYSKKAGDRWIDWELQKRRELAEMRCSGASQDAIRNYQDRMRVEKMPSGIVSVAADTKIAGLVYVGTKNSGLWVSTTYGKWWKQVPVIESAKKYPIRCIAMRPNQNPKEPREIVFVSQKAFYKSIDSGKTWATTGLDVDRDVSFIAYDPFDPNYLFAGLRNFAKTSK